MGEVAVAEEKKTEENKVEEKKTEENKVEEKKPEEEGKAQEKDKASYAEKPAEDKKSEETKEADEEAAAPAQEIVLKVFMHCEGCARKVRRSLKGFQGVDDVVTDCKTQKVIVKGEKADPLKVLERVQRKSHRRVELLSPIPKPPAAAEEKKKPDPEETPKPKENKPEAQVILVVLKVHMHCEACAQELKKRILKMKGVKSVEPDLKNSEVSVKGVFESSSLVKYVYKRTGKHALIIKQETETKEHGVEEKKPEEGGDKDEKDGVDKDKKEGGDGGEVKEDKEEAEGKPVAAADTEDTTLLVEMMKKNEFLYHYPDYLIRYVDPIYSQYTPPPAQAQAQPQPQRYEYIPGHYPPPPISQPSQMFSDENPNACSIM